jgi:2-amino-4-hydroxy-6-hydroxymethyldihydropteridine diphosphokinase
MNRAFLLTGSNLGDRISLLNLAVRYIEKELGSIVNLSHIYRSESWGYKSFSLYFNQCIEIETVYEPHALMEKVLEIEAKMGRVRIAKGYSDREIDIDILFCEQNVIDDGSLIIPHPRIHLRKFALVPMNEIAGDFIHPLLKKSISELLDICPDKSIIRMVS